MTFNSMPVRLFSFSINSEEFLALLRASVPTIFMRSAPKLFAFSTKLFITCKLSSILSSLRRPLSFRSVAKAVITPSSWISLRPPSNSATLNLME